MHIAQALRTSSSACIKQCVRQAVRASSNMHQVSLCSSHMQRFGCRLFFFCLRPGKTVFFVCWQNCVFRVLVCALRGRASVYLMCVLCERVLACNGALACTFAGGLPETFLPLSLSQTKNNLTNCFSVSLPRFRPLPPSPPPHTGVHQNERT